MLKKVLLWTGGALALVVVLVLVAASRQPGAFRIERSAELAAPPSAVFACVNDFHAWERWSPWAKLDPAMTSTYEGPASGVGAKYSWAGNDDVGQGRMTVLESRPDSLVRIRLEFFEPFAADNVAEFTFVPAGAGTRATWSMTGNNSFAGKVFCLFMDMDKLVGADFERGLTALGAAAATAAR